jgi:uncharacterized protein YlzI (FlbEa/FlbD family)
MDGLAKIVKLNNKWEFLNVEIFQAIEALPTVALQEIDPI